MGIMEEEKNKALVCECGCVSFNLRKDARIECSKCGVVIDASWVDGDMMNFAFEKLKAADPNGDALLGVLAKERFNELEHKGWYWRSFRNGWTEAISAAIDIISKGRGKDEHG